MVTDSGSETVIGGENPTLKQSAILGQSGIGFGSKTTEGLFSYPTATVNAFAEHVGLVPITGTDAIMVQPTVAV